MKPWEKMTDSERYEYIICTNHTGKMKQMWSISTSVLKNVFCKAHRMVKGSICEKCYAERQMQRQKNTAIKYERATDFLTSRIIAYDDIPRVNSTKFRLEAFGDLNNEIQVVNYFNFARKNEGVSVALWTKNPHLIKRAIETYGIEKPSNLIIIVSSLFVNYELNLEKVQATYPFVDKVFTVYDKGYIKEHGIIPNCGARNCFTCGNCYAKDNGIAYVREIKK